MPRTGTLLLGLSLALSLALPAGCTQIEVRYGSPPPGPAALVGVTPGVTTERELVARLGPPDEYLSPTALGLGRAYDGARRRVDEERDLFDRRVLSWTSETRNDDEFSIPPRIPLVGGFLTIYRHTETTHVPERLVVLLDAHGVVEAVGHERTEVVR